MKWRAFANFVAYTILALYAYMFIWRALAMLIDSIRLKSQAITPLETPMWIPQSLWMLGLAFFFIHVMIYLIQLTFLLAKKRIPEIISTFGLEKVEEEVSREIEEHKTMLTDEK
jgi:divalent metal cation (Fe/Co/Zn/Cd) transporter